MDPKVKVDSMVRVPWIWLQTPSHVTWAYLTISTDGAALASYFMQFVNPDLGESVQVWVVSRRTLPGPDRLLTVVRKAETRGLLRYQRSCGRLLRGLARNTGE